MKLTTGVNFVNILRAAFVQADPKSAEKTDDLIDCISCGFGICGHKSSA